MYGSINLHCSTNIIDAIDILERELISYYILKRETGNYNVRFQPFTKGGYAVPYACLEGENLPEAICKSLLIKKFNIRKIKAKEEIIIKGKKKHLSAMPDTLKYYII